MRAHAAAIQALLAPLGKPVYFRSTSDPSPLNPPSPAGSIKYPYYLVWPSVANPGPDESLESFNPLVSAIFGVTAVGETPGAAALAGTAARARLGEDEPVTLTLTGRAGHIRWSHFGTLDEDTDVALGTGGHPSIDVEFYRVETTPTT